MLRPAHSSLCSMLERAVSLVMAGDLHRVPKHMQRGFSAPFSTSAAGFFNFFFFWFPGVEARRRLSSGPSGRLSVNAADTLGAITRIFVARCDSSVKSFPLGCKNRRWAWRSEPLQTAVCSSHRSVSRSQRNASVCGCVCVCVWTQSRFCHQHKQPKRPALSFPLCICGD